MRKYLVTGGLGFLGAALVKALVRDGHAVRILDNASRGAAERLGGIADHVEIVVGDVRDASLVSTALEGVDSVCHLAYVNGTQYFYDRPAHVLDVAVKGMTNVIDGAIRSGVQELILASSSEVYQTPPMVPTDETAPLTVPDPLNPRYSYGGGKIISELMALNYGRQYFERVVVFRPHNVFGPDMGWEHVVPQFVSRMVSMRKEHGAGERPFPIQGDGEQRRSFIYIDDFIEALMTVINRGSHLNIYHIGTMEEVRIRELAERIAKCVGLRVRIVPGAEAKGGTSRRCPDIAKIRALGFEPRLSLAAGLARTVPWYVEHPEPTRSAGIGVIAEVR